MRLVYGIVNKLCTGPWYCADVNLVTLPRGLISVVRIHSIVYVLRLLVCGTKTLFRGQCVASLQAKRLCSGCYMLSPPTGITHTCIRSIRSRKSIILATACMKHLGLHPLDYVCSSLWFTAAVFLHMYYLLNRSSSNSRPSKKTKTRAVPGKHTWPK